MITVYQAVLLISFNT